MDEEKTYELIGKFIYGTQRVGGSLQDLANWLADDMAVARVPADMENPAAIGDLMNKFAALNSDGGVLAEKFKSYIASLEKRAAS